MKPKAFYGVGIVIVLCLLGCSTSQKTQQNQEEKQVRIHAGNLDRITGMQWILKSMKQDGHDYPLAGETPFIKLEKDGKVSGFASINRYFGSVQVDSQGNLKWSPFGATRMAGPENLMKQEDTFLNSIQKTEQLRSEGIYLIASTKDQQTELVFYVPVK
jgi:heat shock protein HslJ